MKLKAGTYKIKLTPLGSFFFGGEVVFGSENSQEERSRSYLVHSRVLPQQTSLLGMLREKLLADNGLLLSAKSTPTERANAASLVGQKGFDRNGKAQSWGVIEQLSGLVLEDENQNKWQVRPLDDVHGKPSTNSPKPTCPPSKAEPVYEDLELTFDEAAQRLYYKNLDAKSGFSNSFGPSNDSGDAVGLDDLFKSDKRVGITVTNRRNTIRQPIIQDEEDAYFWQSSWRNSNSVFEVQETEVETMEEEEETADGVLDETKAGPVSATKLKSGFSFVFWVKIKAGYENFELLADKVNLGGERSVFNMEVTALEEDLALDAIFDPPTYQKFTKPLPANYQRLVLMSDTYLPFAELKPLGAFVVAETQSFRFFSSDLQVTSNFNDLNSKVSGPQPKGRNQSEQFTLLQQGGVLYVPKAQQKALIQLIENQKDFRTIGYNQYKIA
jgi:CRISPR-associated protein Cmr3